MGLSSITILGLSVFLTGVMTRFAPFRSWVGGFSLAPFGAILFFLLFFGTLFLGGVRTPGTEFVDSLRLARIVLFSSITGFAWIDLVFTRRAASINAVAWIMFGYAVFAMATSAYSPNPTLTLWKGFEVVTHVSVVAMLSRRINSINDALNMLGLSWIVLSFIMISMLVSAVISPAEAFVETISGIAILHGIAFTVNPNTGTQIGGFLLLVAVSYFVSPSVHSNRFAVFALFIFSTSLMLLSHSRTSIIATVITLCMIAIVARKIWFALTVFLLFAIFALSTDLLEYAIDYILRGQSEEQFRGLTGRISFWQIVWSAFIERPILGYGFYASTFSLYGVPGVDNTYLQVLLGGGVALLSVFFLAICVLAAQIIRTRPNRQTLHRQPAYFLLWTQTASLFMLLIARSVTGPSFDAHHINLTLFLACAAAASALSRFGPATLVDEDARPIVVVSSGSKSA